MSEVAVQGDTGMPDEQVQSSVTAGMLLRQARERAGLSLAGLAAALKVPAPKLEALEADDHASFQDHVFMRALAQSVCRTLRMDSAPVMALLPQTRLKSLADERSSINATFKERSFKGAGTTLGRENGSRKVAFIVLLLLAGAAAVYLLPVHEDEGDRPSQPGAADSVALVQPAAPAGESVAAAQAPAALGAAPAQPESAAPPPESPAAPAAAEPSAPAPAPAAAQAPGAGAAQAPADAAPASSGVLVMKANAQSWVQVKDAGGRVVLQKTLAAGETAVADGAVLPLSVIVGNASATEVRVRGEVLDVARTTRDNVARFEVK